MKLATPHLRAPRQREASGTVQTHDRPQCAPESPRQRSGIVLFGSTATDTSNARPPSVHNHCLPPNRHDKPDFRSTLLTNCSFSGETGMGEAPIVCNLRLCLADGAPWPGLRRLVAAAGLEPARPFGPGILSALSLPFLQAAGPAPLAARTRSYNRTHPRTDTLRRWR